MEDLFNKKVKKGISHPTFKAKFSPVSHIRRSNKRAALQHPSVQYITVSSQSGFQLSTSLEQQHRVY